MTIPQHSIEHESSEPMRLQKFLARAGIASRRASEGIIAAGRVYVNGMRVTELGSKVVAGVDEVCVDGVPVQLSDRHITLMLHKPAGYLTAMSDDRGRHCVAELVPYDQCPGLFPVGRLDFDTTGLLLFSTDGNLGHDVLHPSHQVDKTYEAWVAGNPHENDLERLRRGIQLEDGPTQPAQVEQIDVRGNQTLLRITIHEGRKRQVKRMTAAIGYPVVALHRSAFGPLTLGDLACGSYRSLTEHELTAITSAVR